MELLKVICVTCQAKLTVRNPALIGQIVACPRCGSMVEITATSAPESPSQAEPLAVPDTESHSEPNTQVDTELLAAHQQPPGDAPTADDRADPPSPTTRAPLAQSKWVLGSLTGGIAATALVAGILLLREPAEVAAPEPASPAAASLDTPAAEGEPIAVAANPVEPHPVEPGAVASGPVAPNPSEPVDSSAADPNADQTVERTDTPNEKPAGQPDEQPGELLTAQPPLAGASPADAPASSQSARLDPLDWDLENLSLETAQQPPAETSEPKPIHTPAQVTVPPEPQLPSTLPLVRLGPQSGAATRQRDAAAQLAQRLPALRFDQLPLVDCLRLLSQLSGVPVSVAPDQLWMAGIAPDKKVSLDARDLTLGAALQQVLAPLHLEAQPDQEQVILRRKAADLRRAITYPIDDLVSPPTSAQQLADWVQQLVAPTTWQAGGGEGTLQMSGGSFKIEQTAAVQYQVLLLLERLRLARGLAPRSRFPVERLTGRAVRQAAQDRLAQPTTFQFSQFAPIDELFAHWQNELGLPLLVDWPALASAEIWPATTVRCAIHNEPWPVALEKILAPVGLGWRVTVGGVLEITTSEQVQQQLQLELWPLRSALSQAALEKLQTRAARTGGALRYDPDGQVLLALQPATVQRAIAAQLEQAGLR